MHVGSHRTDSKLVRDFWELFSAAVADCNKQAVIPLRDFLVGRKFEKKKNGDRAEIIEYNKRATILLQSAGKRSSIVWISNDFFFQSQNVEIQFTNAFLWFSFSSWLDAKRDDDNVENGLWRIKNTLYNLDGFIEMHPGGADWIRMTKGHDITEAFIVHHIAMEKVEPLLAKYRVKDTIKPRNSKLTFHDDGFYMTLRRKVIAKLPEIKRETKVYSNVSMLCGWNAKLNWPFEQTNSIHLLSSFAVVRRHVVRVDHFVGDIGAALAKHHAGDFLWFLAHLDGNLWAQLPASAR